MFVKEEPVNRRVIEDKLARVGDYVKMDFLQACLKKQLDFDTKKFVLMKLADIYESRKMYLEAGKMLRAAAEINATYASKMQDYLKSMELFVKAGNFSESEASYTKALACSDGIQKERVKAQRKEAYKRYAEEALAKDRRKHALEAYEHLLNVELSPDERKEIQSALLTIYEKLGKIVEYNTLKRSMSAPMMPTAQQRASVHTSQQGSTNISSPARSPFSFREIGLDD